MTMTTLYFIVTLPRLLLYMLLYHWIILNGIILYSNFIHFTTDKTSFYYLSTVRIKRILHNLKNMSMMSSKDATSWFFKAMKNLLDFSLSNISITYYKSFWRKHSLQHLCFCNRKKEDDVVNVRGLLLKCATSIFILCIANSHMSRTLGIWKCFICWIIFLTFHRFYSYIFLTSHL